MQCLTLVALLMASSRWRSVMRLLHHHLSEIKSPMAPGRRLGAGGRRGTLDWNFGIAAMHVTSTRNRSAANANSPLLSPAPMASEAAGRRRRVRLGVRLDARRRCMRDPRGPQGEGRVRGPRRAPVGAA